MRRVEVPRESASVRSFLRLLQPATAHPPGDGGRTAWRVAALIGALYGLAGMSWILWSDAAVLALSTDPGWVSTAQRWKGLAYVLATGLAVVLGVAAGYRRLLRAVQTQADSELRIQDLFERHPQPMWYYELGSLAFLRVNEAALRQYGYSQSEFQRMTLRDLRPPEDLPSFEAGMATRGPGYRVIERVRHRSKSGEDLFVRISAQPAVYGGRQAVLVLCIDISAQVQAQQALERQEQQYRQLHQSLEEVLWLISANGQTVLYVSPAFDRVYGLPSSEFRRNPAMWLELVHPDDREEAQASSARLLAQGHASCQYRIRRPDGQVRWISDRKNLVVDAQGLITMISGIAEDITQSRLDQDALRRTTDELARHNAELERFNHAAVGREIDMIALKREVNQLARALNQPPRYRLDFIDAPSPEPTAGAAPP